MSEDGYATSPSAAGGTHTDGGVLRGVRKGGVRGQAARAIFKATMRVIAEVGSDAALCRAPADF